ncbi:pantothenate kinase [Pseudanabaena sp. FACHB-2040]|uniref:pantothenate kinase n=1 Tax=Pseudanabaena sp. FACHB-2040 TaxID=2692859 RepID=UPI0016829ED9|nr:pantothenate kinase [Pseudanabaena sp. FACHB-2040]MBD2259046.1 pantothenate kinase [Pseudanabaena sp. FACHB-2040]
MADFTSKRREGSQPAGVQQKSEVASEECDRWLALVAGNSRLHWACFKGRQLICSWHTAHLNADQVRNLQAQGLQAAGWQGLAPTIEVEIPVAAKPLPLWAASVVREQISLWQTYPALQVVRLEQVPLQNLYPALGVDRALSLLGAGLIYGWPMLVIDAGTALTFTAGTDHCFVGGAILPGLSLQAQALSKGTDALPQIEWAQDTLPQRWAASTAEAIQSGILYTQLAGMRDYLADWWQQFPAGKAVLTGGNASRLLSALRQTTPAIAEQIGFDPNLMFLGLAACRSSTDH